MKDWRRVRVSPPAIGGGTAEGDEGFGFDVDGAGEIDVVEVETIGERLLYYSPHDKTTSWKEGRYGTADYAGGAIARRCAIL